MARVAIVLLMLLFIGWAIHENAEVAPENEPVYCEGYAVPEWDLACNACMYENPEELHIVCVPEMEADTDERT